MARQLKTYQQKTASEQLCKCGCGKRRDFDKQYAPGCNDKLLARARQRLFDNTGELPTPRHPGMTDDV